MARLWASLSSADRNYEGSRRELGVGERLIAQFLASIGGIGKQLAQENIAIRIDRMHHKMQQFGDIRLKSLTVTLCLRHLQRPPFRVPMGFIDFGGRTGPSWARRCLVARILPPWRRMQGLRGFSGAEFSHRKKPICRGFRRSVANLLKECLLRRRLQATMEAPMKLTHGPKVFTFWKDHP